MKFKVLWTFSFSILEKDDSGGKAIVEAGSGLTVSHATEACDEWDLNSMPRSSVTGVVTILSVLAGLESEPR